MTIYQLFEREDIYGIIEETLKEYYSEVNGLDIDARLSKSRLRNSFVVYPRLGVIISRVPTWKVMKHIYADFNVQGSVLRKIIAWSYISLCWCTFGLLGSRSLYVSKRKMLHRSISIMACNRKIRIFDFKNGYVDAILKVGYHDNYFKNEIKARTSLKYSFIPGIEKIGDRWYREKVLDGCGLVRISRDKYECYCDEVIVDIRRLYSDYGTKMTTDDYGKRLEEMILKDLNLLKKDKGIKDVSYLEDVSKKCLSIIKNADTTIPITLSHGDLQTGNIIVDEKQGRVTIYDWETFGERSVWFDCSRLLLYSVRKEYFITMAQNYDKDKNKSALLLLDEDKNRDMKFVMAVLILEDIIFRIEEIVDLPGETGSGEIASLEDKLRKITWLN